VIRRVAKSKEWDAAPAKDGLLNRANQSLRGGAVGSANLLVWILWVARDSPGVDMDSVLAARAEHGTREHLARAFEAAAKSIVSDNCKKHRLLQV
jgi:hypothetical protein